MVGGILGKFWPFFISFSSLKNSGFRADFKNVSVCNLKKW
jgi:hypothetical protein